MEEIEIPDFEDIEWQQDTLRKLDLILTRLGVWIPDDDGQEVLEEAQQIVDALRQYSGY